MRFFAPAIFRLMGTGMGTGWEQAWEQALRFGKTAMGTAAPPPDDRLFPWVCSHPVPLGRKKSPFTYTPFGGKSCTFGCNCAEKNLHNPDACHGKKEVQASPERGRLDFNFMAFF